MGKSYKNTFLEMFQTQGMNRVGERMEIEFNKFRESKSNIPAKMCSIIQGMTSMKVSKRFNIKKVIKYFTEYYNSYA